MAKWLRPDGGSASRTLSAPDGGARLAAMANKRNTLVATPTNHAAFLTTHLLFEDAFKIRGSLKDGFKRCVVIALPARIPCLSFELRILTDLQILQAEKFSSVAEWSDEIESNQVLVCTSEVLYEVLDKDILSLSCMNLMIIESCHSIECDDHLQKIMTKYGATNEMERPRILALTYPLFSHENHRYSKTKEKHYPKKYLKKMTKPNVPAATIIQNEIDVNESIINNELQVKNFNEDDINDELTDAIKLVEINEINIETCLEVNNIEKTSCENVISEMIEDNTDISSLSNDVNSSNCEDLLINNDHDKFKIDLNELNCEISMTDSNKLPDKDKGDDLSVESDSNSDDQESIGHGFDDLEMYSKFEWKLEEYEKKLYCVADLAEDIEGFKRLTWGHSRPKEFLVQYIKKMSRKKLPNSYMELKQYMIDTACGALEFFEDHRFDPCEIYEDETFTEELKNIPDPTLEPKQLINMFLFALDEFGPYGADKAAFKLLMKVENMKIKTPYERHFLLMCVCTTLFVQIRCAADNVFSKCENELEKMQAFCKPKVLRFFDVLKQFKPSETDLENAKQQPGSSEEAPKELPATVKDDMTKEKDMSKENGDGNRCARMLNDIEQCDFSKIANALEDKVNVLEMGLKELPVVPTLKSKFQERDFGFKKRSSIRERRSIMKASNANWRRHYLSDSLCGVVILREPILAEILFLILSEATRCDPDLSFIQAQYTAGIFPDPNKELKDYERLRKKQEEVLKKFRMHECNLLLATNYLEENIELPRCNLVLRWDQPESYYWSCWSRAKARAIRSTVCSLVTDKEISLHKSAVYMHLDQVMKTKCGCGSKDEPSLEDEDEADRYSLVMEPYCPMKQDVHSLSDDVHRTVYQSQSSEEALLPIDEASLKVNEDDESIKVNSESDMKDEHASVDLTTAISLINRYCGKLPSDTFTRLAPTTWIDKVRLPNRTSGVVEDAYICTLRLPVNCPVKYNIVGHPMRTKCLARRMTALQACRILHISGELDSQLMPIGKENYNTYDQSHGSTAPLKNARNETDIDDLARPGTTKRRQYYYKKVAWSLTDCEPIMEGENKRKANGDRNKENLLYKLDCELCCPLPERYNTRGRRIHAPQNSTQALALLTSRHIRKIPSFPVYTRSGEVRVKVVQLFGADVKLNEERVVLIKRFMHFVFADVLRIRRRGMRMTSDIKQNNYYIVPTKKFVSDCGKERVDIDWAFLKLIFEHTENRSHIIEKKIDMSFHGGGDDEDEVTKSKTDESQSKKVENPFLKPGQVFQFDPERYKEAVVTPWYRNQDQPQYFLVAEICWQLNADSPFPSATHKTFRHYYTDKYGVEITQPKQPLLDVDHTSGRLNLLTPRYVNRKGVALPVSSDKTRRARRERLDQKQLLVPELSATHPFGAPLWAAAVALPAVLYRINALLIADEIRRSVAIEVGLGIPDINEETMPGFEWPPLDFGWSLAEVLKDGERKSKEKGDKSDVKMEDRGADVKDEECVPKTECTIASIDEVTDVHDSDIEEIKHPDDVEEEFEIGTWSNEMAGDVPMYNTAKGGLDWSKAYGKEMNAFSVADSDCSYMSSDFDTDDTDYDSNSDMDDDTSGFCSSKSANAAMGLRIEYRTAHEAEAVELNTSEANSNKGPITDAQWEIEDREAAARTLRSGELPPEHKKKFQSSIDRYRSQILDKNLFIDETESIEKIITATSAGNNMHHTKLEIKPEVRSHIIDELFPFSDRSYLDVSDGRVTLESVERSKRSILNGFSNDLKETLRCFAMKDVEVCHDVLQESRKASIGFDKPENYADKVARGRIRNCYRQEPKKKPFDFDCQPDLDNHPGPNPSVILQALTMSNANDGINLERLETVGDSFLKFAITACLYCAKPGLHEGKLSHMRSKQVSNLNLYRLGKEKNLGEKMIASKFEPHDNWLPPGYTVPRTLAARTACDSFDVEIDRDRLKDAIKKDQKCPIHSLGNDKGEKDEDKGACCCPESEQDGTYLDHSSCFIPYNLITQHSIPDKSVADCVEALIGAYLVECGPRGALLLMSWLGIPVLPMHHVPIKEPPPFRSKRNLKEEFCYSDFDSLLPPGHLDPILVNGEWFQPVYGRLKAPPSPLLRLIADPDSELNRMLSGYEKLEETLQYRFRDRSLLLQALTHASHQTNNLTDCYQRLELLGDAVLDYIITRLLYEDERRHSPGALTDLRSALVNNTIFATLAVRHGFHKYFRHMSTGLHEVLAKYVRIQEENGHSISEEHYLIHEDEMDQAVDVEVPKALGDLFESIAGAIYIDSGMSLGAVWRSYANLMASELEMFSAAAPKSPVRELLEAEPDTAKFHKPERLADGRRVRVCVEVFGRGIFKGIGRNYRIAKGTAARCALRHLRGQHRMLSNRTGC